MRFAVSSLLLTCCLLVNASAYGQNQVFFLDFDSGSNGSINYTTQMRDDVQSQMETIFQDFGIVFTQSSPGGLFSTLTFNAGGAGGLAQDIDFRNLNKTDNAVINIDGLGITGTANIVRASANIGAHEGGHLLGIRHHDSFGPIGSGVSPNVGGGPWTPDYPGPTAAIETNDHVMASPGSVGSSIADVQTPNWLSERSAIKLAYNEFGNAVNEGGGDNNSLATADAITLESIAVANTIISGQNAGLGPFDVDMLAVVGTLDSAADTSDFYSFAGLAGDLINIEIITIADRLNGFDTTVSVFDSLGNFVDYYGDDAFNDDELEATDSQILDLVLSTDDTYFVQVDSFGAGATGDYEFFISRFNGAFAIPEPTSLSLITLAGLALCGTRRRRKRPSIG